MSLKISKIIITGLVAAIGTCLSAQNDVFSAAQRAKWLQKAEECKPVLVETPVHPLRVVKLQPNPAAFPGWEMVDVADISTYSAHSAIEQSGVIVDFGTHITGYFSCDFELMQPTMACDAPTRLKFTFGETPAE
ncbi:MAG: hypothetical protein LBN37_07395, partial [Bacteroidales bacterium]|nr:hypothetical protein [Bacteroidales bacterium]